jgi:hypothetical protein
MLDRAEAAETIQSADDCCFAAAAAAVAPSIADGGIRARRRPKRGFDLLPVALVREVEVRVDSVSVIDLYDLSAVSCFVVAPRVLPDIGVPAPLLRQAVVLVPGLSLAPRSALGHCNWFAYFALSVQLDIR